MPRIASYICLIGALIVAILFISYSSQVSYPAPIAIIHTASSTTPSTATSTNQIATTTSIKTESAQPKKIITPVPAVITPPVSTSVHVVTAPATPPPSAGNSSLDTSASSLRGALVNILCYAPAGSKLHSISGSGIFIDPKGIILTNAHIAQYFLLADLGVSCTIRSGSPATNSYYANLIYIPTIWLQTNANVLTQTAPIGTGEYDFALIAIYKSATTKALPSPFPYISLSSNPPNAGTPIVIASYGAQFLQPNQIAADLFPTIVSGSVKDIFTFATNTIDVLALGGSAAAQEGSSGGGIADSSGTLVGTITTSTTEGSTDTRSLDAITASYIRAEYASETGESIDVLLSKPTSVSISDYALKISSLESIITSVL